MLEILVLLFTLVFIGTGVLILTSFSVTHFFGAPFVATKKSVAKSMLRFADLKGDEKLLDIGSGSGTILLEAVRHYNIKHAIGYEINPILVFVSKVLMSVYGVGKKVNIVKANFFKIKLPDVDVVLVYLWPETMDKMREKLKNELSPETKIISRAFIFSGVKESKKDKIAGVSFYLYKVKDL